MLNSIKLGQTGTLGQIIFYHGKTKKWAKFTHTLRMKFSKNLKFIII